MKEISSAKSLFCMDSEIYEWIENRNEVTKKSLPNAIKYGIGNKVPQSRQKCQFLIYHENV